MGSRPNRRDRPSRKLIRPKLEPGIAARASNVFGSQLFRIATLLILTLGFQPFLASRLFFTGDEPHYLLAAVSFLRDGDFNLVNNFRERHYRQFGGVYEKEELKPQWVPTLDHPVIPAEHGTSFPLVIVPAYRLAGVTGVRTFLVVLAALTCLLVGSAADALTGRRWAGTLAALLLAVSPTWQMQASRVYPDILAGFLASIAILFIVRQAVSPSRSVSFGGSFATGLCLGLLPILYLKYVVLAAPLALAALVASGMAKSKGFYAGAGGALVLGVVDFVLFGSQGAGAGNFARTHPYLFAIVGASGRYWKQWFDSHHGLFVYQPYTLLALWASLHYLRPVYAPNLRNFLRDEHNTREKVLLCLAMAALAYTGMHGVWTAAPGWCAPGRYLAALLPVLCILIAAWATQADAFRTVRLFAIGVPGVLVLGFPIGAIRRTVQPDFIFRSWIDLFPRYWDSWHNFGPQFKPDQVGGGVYLCVAFIVLTKVAAGFYRARELRKETPVTEADY